MIRADYPETVIEVLDDDVSYPDGVIEAVQAFAQAGPWRDFIKSRKRKFQRLNCELARACNKPEPTLMFRNLDGGSSGASCYMPQEHRIVLTGRLSVVTYLHEFAHSLGLDEREACRWSINLFRRCFPRQCARLIHVGHTLIRASDISATLTKESVR
jgi:hypothetical protein